MNNLSRNPRGSNPRRKKYCQGSGTADADLGSRINGELFLFLEPPRALNFCLSLFQETLYRSVITGRRDLFFTLDAKAMLLSPNGRSAQGLLDNTRPWSMS